MRMTHIRKPSHFIGIDTVSGVQGEIEEFSFFHGGGVCAQALLLPGRRSH